MWNESWMGVTCNEGACVGFWRAVDIHSAKDRLNFGRIYNSSGMSNVEDQSTPHLKNSRLDPHACTTVLR